MMRNKMKLGSKILAGVVIIAGTFAFWTLLKELRIAKEVVALERASLEAMEMFENKQTEALLTAMRSVYRLQKLNKQESNRQKLTSSPNLALQHILDHIQEQWIPNRIDFADSFLNTYFTRSNHMLTFNKINERQSFSFPLPSPNKKSNEWYPLIGYWSVNVDSTEMSSDGKWIAVASDSGSSYPIIGGGNKILVWNTEKGLKATLEHGKEIDVYIKTHVDVKFTSDNQHLVTQKIEEGKGKTTIMIWDLQGNLLKVFEKNKLQEYCQEVDNEKLISSKLPIISLCDQKPLVEIDDGVIILRDARGNKLATVGKNTTKNVDGTLNSDDKQSLSVDRSYIRLWNLRGNSSSIRGNSLIVNEDKNIGGITDIALSLDNQYIAVRYKNGVIHIWDIQGKQISEFRVTEYDWSKHTGDWPIAFSFDGKYLISSESFDGSDGFKIRRWDLQGNLIQTYQRFSLSPSNYYDRVPERIYPSSDGKKIGLSSRSHNYIWHLNDNRKVIAKFRDNNGTIHDLKFSPKGNHYALLRYSGVDSYSGDTSIELWRLGGQEKITTINRLFLSDLFDSRLNMCFSPDSQHLLTHSRESLEVWDLQGNLKAVLEKGWVSSLDNALVSCDNLISPNGQYTYIRKDNQFEIWALEGNHITNFDYLFHNPDYLPWMLKFSPNSQKVAIVYPEASGNYSQNDSILLWDLEENFLERISGRDMDFLDEHHIVSVKNRLGKSPTAPQLWNLTNKRLVKRLRLPFSLRNSLSQDIDYSNVRLNPEGKYLINPDFSNKRLLIWSLEGQPMANLDFKQLHWSKGGRVDKLWWYGISPFMTSPDGQLLATIGNDNKIRIWTTKGQQIAEYNGDLVSFNADWTQVIIGDRISNTVTLYSLDNLAGLLEKGCNWLWPYLTSDRVTDKDREMCGISEEKSPPLLGEIPRH